jgi:CheY-like chemotaxis protein
VLVYYTRAGVRAHAWVRSHARLQWMSGGPEKKSSGTRVRPGRVLVIDDEGVVGDELARSLEEHDVVTVDCGEDALALVTAGQRFDLILCDVMMPGMNGAALLAHLEVDHPAQAERLIFMMDRMISPIIQHLLEGVPNLCIERPFDMEGLRALIERRIRTVPDSRTGSRTA